MLTVQTNNQASASKYIASFAKPRGARPLPKEWPCEKGSALLIPGFERGVAPSESFGFSQTVEFIPEGAYVSPQLDISYGAPATKIIVSKKPILNVCMNDENITSAASATSTTSLIILLFAYVDMDAGFIIPQEDELMFPALVDTINEKNNASHIFIENIQHDHGLYSNDILYCSNILVGSSRMSFLVAPAIDTATYLQTNINQCTLAHRRMNHTLYFRLYRMLLIAAQKKYKQVALNINSFGLLDVAYYVEKLLRNQFNNAFETVWLSSATPNEARCLRAQQGASIFAENAPAPNGSALPNCDAN